uniref:CASP-like protein n=1 Tax=Picea sitchensis TaxID=3332 RepID=A9NQV9_PICSI|nr:unknown [Picea sitchensis]
MEMGSRIRVVSAIGSHCFDFSCSLCCHGKNVMVALVTAGALAAGIVYLVEKAGNARASWVSVWSQFDSSSCFAVLALILHVLLSGVILYKQALNIKFKKLDSVD